MTEQEYVDMKALGTISALTGTLRDLVLENLKDTIDQQEYLTIIIILGRWERRLMEKTEIK